MALAKNIRIFNMDLLTQYLNTAGAEIDGNYEKISGTVIIQYKCNCGNMYRKKFNEIVYYGGAYCKECTKKNKEIKKMQTCIQTYGVSNPSQVDEIKNKKEETSIKNYGVAYALQSKTVRLERENTNIEKFGVKNLAQSDNVKLKIKTVFNEKYGGHPMYNDVIKTKVKETCLTKYGGYPAESEIVKEKMKNTWFEKYGCWPQSHPDISQKTKNTNIKNYGVSYPSQNQDIMAKVQETSKKYKKYTLPSGKIINVQGYEPFALNILLKTYNENQIITDRNLISRIKYSIDNKDKYYFPDIYIPSENRIIEVKSTWTFSLDTDKILCKRDATIAEGYIFELWIFNCKGERVYY